MTGPDLTNVPKNRRVCLCMSVGDTCILDYCRGNIRIYTHFPLHIQYMQTTYRQNLHILSHKWNPHMCMPTKTKAHTVAELLLSAAQEGQLFWQCLSHQCSLKPHSPRQAQCQWHKREVTLKRNLWDGVPFSPFTFPVSIIIVVLPCGNLIVTGVFFHGTDDPP